MKYLMRIFIVIPIIPLIVIEVILGERSFSAGRFEFIDKVLELGNTMNKENADFYKKGETRMD